MYATQLQIIIHYVLIVRNVCFAEHNLIFVVTKRET
jgi:hypothetical protein